MVPRITSIHPLWALEGGQVVITGEGFHVDPPAAVRIGGTPARVVRAAPTALTVVVPEGLDGGTLPVRLDDVPGETAYVDVAMPLSAGLHLVDSPAFDRHGNLYATFSGSRGQEAPIPVFLIRPGGARQPFGSGIPNPTSLACGPDGALYVSSRFEGSVYRVAPDGTASVFATDLGVPCGLAFGRDGALYVGDRSGSILRVEDGRTEAVATVPASVAAIHLAFGPDGWLYCTAPTLAPRDPVLRVSLDGRVETFAEGFGRPQGLAFDSHGRLYVVEALAGASGIWRYTVDGSEPRMQVLAGGGLVGLAFDPGGGLVLATSEAVYRLDVPLTPL